MAGVNVRGVSLGSVDCWAWAEDDRISAEMQAVPSNTTGRGIDGIVIGPLDRDWSMAVDASYRRSGRELRVVHRVRPEKATPATRDRNVADPTRLWLR